jgi:hypothetical protein
VKSSFPSPKTQAPISALISALETAISGHPAGFATCLTVLLQHRQVHLNYWPFLQHEIVFVRPLRKTL